MNNRKWVLDVLRIGNSSKDIYIGQYWWEDGSLHNDFEDEDIEFNNLYKTVIDNIALGSIKIYDDPMPTTKSVKFDSKNESHCLQALLKAAYINNKFKTILITEEEVRPNIQSDKKAEDFILH